MKDALALLATALTFAAFYPYLRAMLRDQARPHVFSWVIWGVTTCIVFSAQLSAGGGAGAWPIGLSGLITLAIALLAYQRRSTIRITRSDWAFFIAALAAIPLWAIMQNPLWAVVLLTAIDLLGMIPTARKAYHHPWDEPIVFFALMSLRNAAATAALEQYSLATALFPAAIGIACALMVILLVWRRRTLRAGLIGG